MIVGRWDFSHEKNIHKFSPENSHGTWTWWFSKRNLLLQGWTYSGSMLVIRGCNFCSPNFKGFFFWAPVQGDIYEGDWSEGLAMGKDLILTPNFWCTPPQKQSLSSIMSYFPTQFLNAFDSRGSSYCVLVLMLGMDIRDQLLMNQPSDCFQCKIFRSIWLDD